MQNSSNRRRFHRPRGSLDNQQSDRFQRLNFQVEGILNREIALINGISRNLAEDIISDLRNDGRSQYSHNSIALPTHVTEVLGQPEPPLSQVVLENHRPERRTSTVGNLLELERSSRRRNRRDINKCINIEQSYVCSIS